MHGGVAKEDLGQENVAAVKGGLENLVRHVENVRRFGVPVVVAINRFSADTDAELASIQDHLTDLGVTAIEANHWADGSAGTTALAEHVVAMVDGCSTAFKPLYGDEENLFSKIETVAREIYGAGEVTAERRVREQLRQWEEAGYGHFPVCMAKTQYSFSTDPSLKGAPRGHSLAVREVRLLAGAEFVVAICGEIMTMPGLPRVPAANSIGIDEDGHIAGLF